MIEPWTMTDEEARAYRVPIGTTWADFIDRMRDASDDSPARQVKAYPDRWQEPFDMTLYAGPHGPYWPSVVARGQPAVCVCGWHPDNHPGFILADHLRDFGASPGTGSLSPVRGTDNSRHGARQSSRPQRAANPNKGAQTMSFKSCKRSTRPAVRSARRRIVAGVK